MRSQLILFVKAPSPGFVKTRLVPPLSFEQAARMYKGWAQDIYRRSYQLDSVNIEVAYDPHPNYPTPQWLDEKNGRVPFFLQKGENLGERLKNAFDRSFQAGFKKVAIIGSDSPGLPLKNIQDAFAALETADLALGPSLDGGYYLIGLKESLPELLDGISWSTNHVLSQTLDAAKRRGTSFHLLEPYFDVDYAQDLERIKEASVWRKVVIPAKAGIQNRFSAD
ncbi:MAG: TIGR04282 family arsenosugar biosynthesis glycosyltransferase [Elusimicrobia bacterium]|nr:TIGR04282 family arsenosugar biosynthesis glycosyltransferase [Elusimicrobiota bacterium]